MNTLIKTIVLSFVFCGLGITALGCSNADSQTKPVDTNTTDENPLDDTDGNQTSDGDTTDTMDVDTDNGVGTDTGVDSEHRYQCIIVGGGISGLTAAYQLKQHDVLVLEKRSKVGGRIWEGDYRGFSYAKGAEYLGEPYGLLASIIAEQNLKPVEIKYPADCYYNPDVPGYGNIHIYNGFDGIAFMHVMEDGGNKKALKNYNRFMSETTALLDQSIAAGEYPPFFNTADAMAALDQVTMRQWFQQQGFGQSYQKKWNSHTRGLFGANMDEVSILMAISELGWEYYQEESIEMPDEEWNEYLTDLYPEESFTFTRGISEIPQALAQALGNKIVVDATVTHVQLANDTYSVTYTDKNQRTVTLKSNSVIMAVPSPIALEIAPALITGEKRTLLENIEYSQYLTVNLFSKEPIQNFTFDLALPGDRFITDIYDSLWVQKWENPNNPLNDDVFITTAYIAGQSYKDKLVQLSDEEIINKLYLELDEVLPGSSAKVDNYEINRFKYAYPVFGLGAYKNIQHLNGLNDANPRTFMLAGDYMTYPTLEAAIEQAEHVAEKIVLGDPH